MAETMRAMTYDTYGGPEVLRLVDMPLPKVGPGEVLVRVKAAGVNPVDWKLMAGGLDGLMDIRFPVVPGWDVAGVVERVGIDVPEYAVGDEVIGYARKDYVHGGTMAEYVTVAVRHLARKPAGLSWPEAAGVPLAGLTAYQTLTRLGLQRGETVLIHNAAGGVGSAAVQIAHALSARVLASCSPASAERVRALGAEPVAYGDGLADAVRALVPGGVDVVADFIGGVLDATLAVLAEGGRHASIADAGVLAEGGQWIWVRPDADDLATLATMLEDGRLRVDVAETFPLERLADAFRLSMTGHVRGKIAITID
ncbi:NADP-dependent oxidoreductase [Raineyella sp. LH-20]|uniref:NADP-dependent oxidoreductase n=1 Tax=Raineyella sp. LH-20 TaxID=3081204 RepID=UPI002954D675|nr:NADP-dependent oxidoreductase [Raineyella sp. LH-20]WOP19993.1 NADP-dependent oxidoreductase [Raineyella sp. LH-20]